MKELLSARADKLADDIFFIHYFQLFMSEGCSVSYLKQIFT